MEGVARKETIGKGKGKHFSGILQGMGLVFYSFRSVTPPTLGYLTKY